MNYRTELNSLLGPLEAAARLESWDDVVDIAREIGRLATVLERERNANAAGVVKQDIYEQQVDHALAKARTKTLDKYGYPEGWPKCSCGAPALDGKANCGRPECKGMTLAEHNRFPGAKGRWGVL